VILTLLLCSWLTVDAPLHAGASAGIYGTAYGAARAMHCDPLKAALLAGGGTLAVGVAKETRDALMPGNYWSWSGLAANCVGIASGAALTAGIEWTVKRWRTR